jgi:PKD repeat protein
VEDEPVHIYTKEVQDKVTLIVTENANQSQQQTKTVTVGTPPEVTILSPAEGQTFDVGEILQMVGWATDSKLDDSQLEWSALAHQ